jgi:hypothetical protein
MDWSQSFDTSVANRFHSAGYIPELTWQPQANGAGIPNTQVTTGAYDSYINQTAQTVKSLGYPIRINLAPEMNGGWTTWGVTTNGNTNETHKAFYQYVVNKFRTAGASNVQWIWAPNVHTYGEVYTFGQIFPGDTYVDYVGLDGYNWGTSQTWSTWQSFASVFDSSYRDLTAISSKPILIMEMASAEVGGSKANWILDMFSTIRTNYPRIQGFTWFNENKETDWRIESSQASHDAFIAGYRGTATLSATPTPTTSATVAPTAKAIATAKTTSSAATTNTSTPTPTTSVPGTTTSTATPTQSSDSSLTSDSGSVSATILPTTTPLSSTKMHSRRLGDTISQGSGQSSHSQGGSPLMITILSLGGVTALAGTGYLFLLRHRNAALELTAGTENTDQGEAALLLDKSSTDYESSPGSTDGVTGNQG